MSPNIWRRRACCLRLCFCSSSPGVRILRRQQETLAQRPAEGFLRCGDASLSKNPRGSPHDSPRGVDWPGANSVALELVRTAILSGSCGDEEKFSCSAARPRITLRPGIEFARSLLFLLFSLAFCPQRLLLLQLLPLFLSHLRRARRDSAFRPGSTADASDEAPDAVIM